MTLKEQTSHASNSGDGERASNRRDEEPADEPSSKKNQEQPRADGEPMEIDKNPPVPEDTRAKVSTPAGVDEKPKSQDTANDHIESPGGMQNHASSQAPRTPEKEEGEAEMAAELDDTELHLDEQEEGLGLRSNPQNRRTRQSVPIGPEPPPANPVPSEQEQRSKVRGIMSEFRRDAQAIYSRGAADDGPVTTDELISWDKKLQRELLDDDHFRAGSWNDYHFAWDEMFRIAAEWDGRSKTRREENTILKWLAEGYDFRRDMSQISNRLGEGQKDFPRRLKRVENMLERRVNDGSLTAQEAKDLLKGDLPGDFKMRNCKSAETPEGRALISATHRENVAIGACTEWEDCPAEVTTDELGQKLEQPIGRTGLGMFIRPRDGKERQIFAALYINLWMRKVKVHFETLNLLISLISTFESPWATTSDLKSGTN